MSKSPLGKSPVRRNRPRMMHTLEAAMEDRIIDKYESMVQYLRPSTENKLVIDDAVKIMRPARL